MKIFYTKKFSKDLDQIGNDVKLKKNILQIINKIKGMDSLVDLEGVRKIQGSERHI